MVKKEIRNKQKNCTYFEPIKKDNTCKYKCFAGNQMLDNYSNIDIWYCEYGGGVRLRCPHYWEIRRF